MTLEALVNMLGQVLPAVGLYVAIRVDMAAMKVRLDHLERDMYPAFKPPRND